MICSDIWRKYHSCYFKIVSNFTSLTAREIMYNNFEISLTTNHAITYTKNFKDEKKIDVVIVSFLCVIKNLQNQQVTCNIDFL